jgi:Holliday junction resolvasome RuvABC DNA-binding subunit
VEILWANFRFWWTNELMIHYLGKGDFSKVEKLLPIRKKLAEKLRINLQKKKEDKIKRDKEKREWVRNPQLSWRMIYLFI